MSDGCEWCGDRGYLYYEGYDYPEWSDEDFTDRDRPVGKRFCSVRHMVLWLRDQGFDVRPDGDTQ